MKESERREAIRRRLALSADRVSTEPPIASGLRPLDEALGGGYPRCGIVEIYGPPSSGKTTIALRSVANAQRAGLTVAWIDADRTFDAAYAASLGVLLEKLTVTLPNSAEAAMEMARELAESAVVDLLVIDSVAALAPMAELAAPMGECSQGLQGSVLASGLRRLAAAATRGGTTALALNQTRGRPSREDDEVSAGGPPLRLRAGVRISLTPGDGARVRFRLLKNRSARAFSQGVLSLLTEGGCVKGP
jgi:recombination protein RecA